MPDRLIDCVLESGARHLTIYSIDSSDPGHGVSLAGGGWRGGRHDHHPRGHQPRTNARSSPGRWRRIQPHGHLHRAHPLRRLGLGGVLTKTGLGTVVEEGKQIGEVNGESYLLETALRADMALTRCRADPWAIWSTGAAAATPPTVDRHLWRLVHRGCDHFCDLGELGRTRSEVPGMFVDMILA